MHWHRCSGCACVRISALIQHRGQVMSWSINLRKRVAGLGRKSLVARKLRRRAPRPGVETLEDRMVPSATLTLSGPETLVAGSNIDASNNTNTVESEMSISVNPTNPLNVAGFVHDLANLNQIQVFY